jgi:hypothetical protein
LEARRGSCLNAINDFTQANPLVEAASAAVTGRRTWKVKRDEPWR